MKPADAQALAERLLQEHGLHDWSFSFDRARRRFGCCHYQKQLITLSLPLTRLNDRPQIEDTLLHEIAHALTPGHGHDNLWKQTCRQLGAAPERLYKNETVHQPPARYLLVCDHCGLRVPRHRRTQRTLACRACCCRHNHGHFTSRYALRWIDNHPSV